MLYRNRLNRKNPDGGTAARLRFAAVFALILPALAACTETPSEPAEQPPSEAGQPAQGDSSAPAPFNAMAVVPPPAPPPPPPIDDNPEQMMGLSGAAVTEKLGKPSLVRREGEAEIWQYRGQRCVLDLFLYGDGKTVEHVDLRSRGNARPNVVRDCFANMLRAAMETS